MLKNKLKNLCITIHWCRKSIPDERFNVNKKGKERKEKSKRMKKFRPQVQRVSQNTSGDLESYPYHTYMHRDEQQNKHEQDMIDYLHIVGI